MLLGVLISYHKIVSKEVQWISGWDISELSDDLNPVRDIPYLGIYVFVTSIGGFLKKIMAMGLSEG